MTESIFTKIIKGEILSYKIAETAEYIAILDVYPLVKGHTLIIPKQQVDYIFDLEEHLFSGLHLFSKKVAAGIEKVIECKRIGVAVVGLEVPHAHIHLIPINSIEDIDFSKPKLTFSDEEYSEIANLISAEVYL